MASNRPRRQIEGEEAQPQKSSRGKLNNMELFGIGLFCVAFLLYGISKCGKEPVVESPSGPVVTEEVVDSPAIARRDENASSFTGTNSDNNSNAAPTAPTNPTVVGGATRKLYVIIDSLRVRQAPNLGGQLVTNLKYGEEITDLGERTVSEKLRVSPDEVRTAPWIKIKNKEGQVGWAFGAYLQFYPVPTTTNIPAEN
ncbi:MAG: SH3 domain-containing protein [Aureispira sp.]|nr:SH3 domain-containing protein [Aureispira sp.]